jgi:hypothetical protein
MQGEKMNTLLSLISIKVFIKWPSEVIADNESTCFGQTVACNSWSWEL